MGNSTQPLSLESESCGPEQHAKQKVCELGEDCAQSSEISSALPHFTHVPLLGMTDCEGVCRKGRAAPWDVTLDWTMRSCWRRSKLATMHAKGFGNVGPEGLHSRPPTVFGSPVLYWTESSQNWKVVVNWGQSSVKLSSAFKPGFQAMAFDTNPILEFYISHVLPPALLWA